MSGSWFVFGRQAKTDLQTNNAHGLYRIIGGWIQLPYPLLESNWIQLLDRLLVLPCRVFVALGIQGKGSLLLKQTLLQSRRANWNIKLIWCLRSKIRILRNMWQYKPLVTFYQLVTGYVRTQHFMPCYYVPDIWGTIMFANYRWAVTIAPV